MTPRHASRLSRRAMLALLLAAPAAATAAASPVAAEPADAPRRVISCAPNLTEMLFALGAGDSVIGVTPFCSYPPEAAELPKHGDLFNPSLEAMLAARPDLIATVPSNRKVIDFFRARPGVEVFIAEPCDTIAEIEATLLALGRIMGRQERAESLVAASRAAVAEVAATRGDTPPVPTIMVLHRDEGALTNLTAIGGGGFLSQLLAAAGGVNVLDPSLGLYPRLNREALLRTRPEVVLEIGHAEDTEAARASMRRAWAPLRGVVPAARDGRMAILADGRLTIPGPDLGRTARLLADALERAG